MNELKKQTGGHKSKRNHTPAKCPFPDCGIIKTQRSSLKVHVAYFHLREEILKKFPGIKIKQQCEYDSCQFEGKQIELYFYHYGFVHEDLKRISAENDHIRNFLSCLL